MGVGVGVLFPAGRRWGDGSQDATSVTVCLTPAFHPYLSLARARRGSRGGSTWAVRRGGGGREGEHSSASLLQSVPRHDPDAGPDADPDAGPDADPDAGPDADPNAGPDADPNTDLVAGRDAAMPTPMPTPVPTPTP